MKTNKLTKSPSFYLILFIAVLACIIKNRDKSLGRDGNYGAIAWDNFGYYMYLPATFIYDDIKLQNDEWVVNAQNKYNLSSNYYQAHKLNNGSRVIQYTSGIAFIYSPAFFVGHTVASLSSKYPPDGFSKPYQLAILIECMLFIFLGLWYLRKFLLIYFNETIATMVIIVMCLGTNYFQIVSTNTCSPHNILFLCYSALLYLTAKWHNNPNRKDLFYLGTIAAIMVLSRPNELLFLIIPLLWKGGKFKSITDKFSYLFKHKNQLVLLLFPFIVFGLVQPLYWNYVSGDWIFDSYKNEDFKLLKPYILEYLFSYKKGWLLYTPMMIMGIIGFYPFFKKNKILAIPFLLFFILNVWILSSWDCWWYADSFSQRSIVQSYPIMALPFGYLLVYISEKNHWVRAISKVVLAILIAFNLFQIYQFSVGILHSQRMTKEYYWNVFGVTDIYAPNRALLDFDRSIYYLPEKPLPKHKIIYYNNFNTQNQLEINGFKEEGNLVLSSENKFSKKIRFAYKDIADSSYCYLIARFRFKSDYEAVENPFGVEFDMIDSYNGKSYAYRYRGVNDIDWFERGSWSSMDIVVIPPYLRNSDDSIQFKLKLSGNYPVLIDNFSIEVLDPKVLGEVKSKMYMTDYHTLEVGEWSAHNPLIKNKGYELVDSLQEYSTTLLLNDNQLFGKSKVLLSANYNNVGSSFSPSLIVNIVDSNGENIVYKSFPLLKDGWQNEQFELDLPNQIGEGYKMKVYVWNKGLSPLFLRDLKVEIIN